MGSNINFNNFENEQPLGDSNGRPPGSGNFGLIRQSSIYSLTFDEFQNTLGGIGKDFGSMNMDELLKNIWSAEEAQSISTTTTIPSNGGGTGPEGGTQGGGVLQRQGSLTLPRTISQKKVDEVWKDIAKEFGCGKDGGDGASVPQRQQTLGEMTLEEFLFRAGVVREDAQPQPFGKPNLGAGGIFGNLAQSANNGDSGFGINFQQPGRGVDLMGNRLSESNQISMQSTNLPLNVSGLRSSQHTTQAQLGQQPPQQRQQPLMPKQPAASYVSTMLLPGNAQLSNTGVRGGMTGLGDPGMNNNLMPSSGLQGGGMNMIGLGPAGSPAALSSDGLAKSNGDTSSVSPMPYAFNGGFRGRKSANAVEKVVERRQRRMIKNRESAARSRARKQAYTMELEQEIAKLKEENEELRRKQAEILEKQKNQVQEMTNAQSGPRKRLRRMHTGPWEEGEALPVL
ncbi:ABSCISIC ACID-INSENSITIVE 5-like protein 5 isoform X2 [Silene latifolia]|uniref:ABSCISIC ACID-INSENSITIVE 5-like protein 5 isoform X2 n=1 Tax=Silene latifolia TaxID=37657 RepID=UPI003D771D23